MSDLPLDTIWDIETSDANIPLTSSLQARQQDLAIKLKTFLGEWFLNTEIGVPWFQDILVKGPNFVTVSTILKREILETPGVLSLSSFDMDFDESDRILSLDFKVQTDDGELDFSQEVEI